MDSTDYIKGLKKLTKDMPVETAKRLAAELCASIEARKQSGRCACGMPCRNNIGHNAVDQLALLEIGKILSTVR